MLPRALPPLLLLLLTGCGLEPPGLPDTPPEGPAEELPAHPPPEEKPAPLPPASPTTLLEVPIPEGLRESGAVVSVTRLHEAQPARESVVVVPAGSQKFEVQAEAGEVLAVSVLERSGAWVESALVEAGAQAWPGPKLPGRVHRVPREYETLQAAVDAAQSGDTVWVAPGLYRETVRLKSGIRLLGSGAGVTVLDGGGQPVKLVDLSFSENVVVAGFTFQNVGRGGECGHRDDVTLCSGNWYPAGVYADGHQDFGEDPTSALVTHNVFKGNYIAMMLYYRSRAVVRNNVFVGNSHALVANHFGSQVALVANNVFWENTEHAIISQAGYLDIVNNVIARSRTGIVHEYIQTGRIRCNLFFQNERHGADARSSLPPRFTLGEDGNVELEPLFEDPSQHDFRPRPGSPLVDAGCFEGLGFDLDGTRQDVGAHGGALGHWP